MAPAIGVVAHRYAVPRPFGELPVTGTPDWYLEALVSVGARPVLLPGSSAADLLELVDGLVLTGGGDVDPTLHGGDPGLATDVDRERDDVEIALVEAAARVGLPVLGVCRGLQVLVVAFGGNLVGVEGHLRPHEGHDVRTAAGSLLADLVGPGTRTSTLHHQAARDLDPRWVPTAWAEDGTVEAIEWASGDWPAVGVQWHPELAWSDQLDDATGPALFRWLCGAASIRAGGRLRRTLVRS